MGKLGAYNSLEELKEYFDVEYIDTVSDFNELIDHVSKKEYAFYRGVKSATYKMYSSAQRFYIEKHNELPNEMTYSLFLKKLFEISKQLGDCYFTKLYDTMKQENYCQIDIANTKQHTNKEVFDYYQIWAYYNLQHITECSPFLDFSSNFAVALYFASLEIISRSNQISKNKIHNYIEIIAINDKSLDKKKYVSLMEELLSSNNTQEVLQFIYEFDISNYQGNINFIHYRGYSIPLIRSGIECHFSFANANVVKQDGCMMITSIDPQTPFEKHWNTTFGNSQKLKVFLIHKSLLNEICRHLASNLLGSVLVPEQKDFKDEILQLLTKNNN